MNHATPRKILLAVTGISPQIVTETLYALGCEAKENPDAFIPTEVHLITTQTGKTIAVENLLEKGQFQALLKAIPSWASPFSAKTAFMSFKTPEAGFWTTSAPTKKTPGPPIPLRA